MIVGLIRLWELMSFFSGLMKLSGLVLSRHTPYREDPTKGATKCLKQIKFALNALDKMGIARCLM